MKQYYLFFAMVLFYFALGTGCKKKEPAPEMPPSGTMLMDFNDFKDTAGVSNKATHVNWLHSAANVGFWNVVITVGLAVPVASYVVALNQEAKWDKKTKTWTWEYNFNSFGSHHAELTAKLDGDTVIWKMYIDNFNWYYGHSHVNASGGYWMLNESVANQTPLLRIDWQRNSSGISSITYKNVAPSSSQNHFKNNGEYITYGTNASSTEFDRFYNIFLKNDTNTTITNLTEIEWKFSDKHGRVKDPKKFGDQIWHCWNTAFEDVTCP